MICAPSACRSSGAIAFTLPWVPTGMKMGVSIVPCGVCSRPRRAPVCGVDVQQLEAHQRGRHPLIAAQLGRDRHASPSENIASP